MRELFTMWRDTRMIMLTAVTAAVYAAILIPFAGFVIIPGFTAVRPGNVIPVVFGLLFGPAAAWGSAIGNLINDLFAGTFGPGSAFGFVGNFFYGMIGYKLWGSLGPLSSGVEPDLRENAGKQLVEYVVIALTAAAACGAIIAWGVDLLGLVPFPVLGTTITVNNFLAAVILGPPLLYLVYPRVKEMGLLYPDVMVAEDLPSADLSRSQFAAYGIVVVSLVWVALGIFVLDPQTTAQMALGAVGMVALVVLAAISGERLSAMLE